MKHDYVILKAGGKPYNKSGSMLNIISIRSLIILVLPSMVSITAVSSVLDSGSNSEEALSVLSRQNFRRDHI